MGSLPENFGTKGKKTRMDLSRQISIVSAFVYLAVLGLSLALFVACTGCFVRRWKQ